MAELVSEAALPQECLDIAEGKVALGQPCIDDMECGSAAKCSHASACPGTCAAKAAAGEACSKDSVCQTGLKCRNAVCVVPAKKGESCGGLENKPCEGTLLCDGNGDTAGTCKSRQAVMTVEEGGACVPDKPLCKPGLSCAQTSAPASPTSTYSCLKPVSSGGACNWTAWPSQCPADEYCSVQSADPIAAGTCKPYPKVNDPCASGGPYSFCAPGFACIDGVCVTIGENGGACTNNHGCWSSQCGADMKCTAPDVTT